MAFLFCRHLPRAILGFEGWGQIPFGIFWGSLSFRQDVTEQRFHLKVRAYLGDRMQNAGSRGGDFECHFFRSDFQDRLSDFHMRSRRS